MPEPLTQKDVVSTLVAVLVETVFIYIAARFVLDRSSILSALLTAALGSLAAGAVLFFVGGTLGFVLAIAAWALVAALMFGTGWIKGAIVGLVAWVLWVLVTLAIRAVL